MTGAQAILYFGGSKRLLWGLGISNRNLRERFGTLKTYLGPQNFFGHQVLFWTPGTSLGGTPGTFQGPLDLFGNPRLIWYPRYLFGNPKTIWRWHPQNYLAPPELFGTPRSIWELNNYLGSPGLIWDPLDYLGPPEYDINNNIMYMIGDAGF